MPSTGAAPARDTQAAFDFAPKPITDICITRHHGNANSVEANKRVDPWKPSMRRTIVELIQARGERGMTSEELEEVLGKAKHKFSGRLAELKADEVIQVHGSRNGCDVLVCRNTK